MKDITQRMALKALFFFVFLSVVSFKGYSATGDKFQQLRNTISKRYEAGYTAERLNQNVEAYLALFNATTGAFTDVDYTDTAMTNWKPITHLERVSEFAFAYTMEGNNYSGSQDLYNKIVLALEQWYAANPTSTNWWHNQIAVPKSLGLTLIQLRQGQTLIPAALETQLVDRMAANAANMATQEGANLTDVATDYFYRACLTEDEPALKNAISYAFSPLKLTRVQEAEVGIRYDYSFHQHGPQLYIGGYGEELIKGVTNFALNTVGTEYALQDEQLNILSNFMRNTYITTLRGQFIHFNAVGRSVSRKGSTYKNGFARYITDMVSIDSQKASEYEDAVKRMKALESANYNVASKNILYPVSDYVMHIRNPYSMSVRTASTRTAYIEHGNGENLKSYFMSFGGTVLMQKGDEYKEIFGVWDWARVPGVTNPQVTTIPKRAQWGVTGKDTFVGGVSDSLYAVSTLVHEDAISGKKTNAKKSWFFFDDEIVCLGTGIYSESTFNINTTVEQSLLVGDVTASKGGVVSTLAKGEYNYAGDLNWVLHNDIGYFFPKGGNVWLTGKEQEGKWIDINTAQSDALDKKDVFTLYFDHGVNPQNDSYAYIIVPNKASAASMNQHPISNVEILRNDEQIQVVRHKALDMMQLVFFEAGIFEVDGMSIEVDKPSTLLLKNISTSRVTMHVADPAQSRTAINIKTIFPNISNRVIKTICDYTNYDIDHAGLSQMFILDQADNGVLYTRESAVLGDTFVQDGTANENTNHGSENTFLVKMDGVGYAREGFIKMSIQDLYNLKNPNREEVGRVELALTTTYTNASADQVYWILNPVEDTTWDENVVTYANKPAHSDVVASQLKGHVRGIGVDDRVYFDITDYAKAQFAQGKTEIAFRVYNNAKASDNKHDTKFATKENTTLAKQPKIITSVYKKVIKNAPYSFESSSLGDTFVQDGAANENKNNGSAGDMLFKKSGVGYNREAFIKLSIADMYKIDDPDTQEIDKVELALTITYTNASANQVYWILNPVEDTTWDENTLTFVTKPAHEDRTIAKLKGQLKGTVANDRVVFDITDYAKEEFAKGKKEIALRIYNDEVASDGKHDTKFATKENSTASRHPKLTVTVREKIKRAVPYSLESGFLDDAFVQDGAANENVNHGAEETFLVKMDGVGYNREGFVKVSIKDMYKVDDPETQEAGKVELSLYTTYTNASVDQVFWILNPVEDTNWTESQLTFATKPLHQDTVVAEHKGHVRGAGVEDRIYFDITEYAKEQYAKGKEELAFRVYNNMKASDGKHDTKFATKENTKEDRRPKLIVTVVEKTVVDTVPSVPGIRSLKINGEVHDINTPYIICCDDQTKTLKVEIDTEEGTYMNVKKSFTVDVSQPMNKEFKIWVGKSKKGIVGKYTLAIEKMFAFDELVTIKQDRELVVNSNPHRNGGFLFTGYEWVKNGMKAGNNKTYTEPQNNQVSNPADYSLVVKAIKGGKVMKLRTCPTTLKLENSPVAKVYPVRARMNETISVETDYYQEGGTIQAYNLIGYQALSVNITDQVTNIKFRLPGIYIVKVTLNNGYEFAQKVIIR